MLANKLARKARSVGLEPLGPEAGSPEQLLAAATRHAAASPHPDEPLSDDAKTQSQLVGELLFVIADLAQRLGVDAEQALRARVLDLRDAIVATEGVPEAETDNR
jgi:hypothetical protein